MSSKTKEIVDKVNAAFAKNKVSDFLSFCADDVRWTMVGDRTVTGKDAISKWMASMMDAEPPNFTVKQVIGEGDFVACYGDMTMKEKGEVVPYSYCDIYRFRGDKIVELNSYVVKTAAAQVAS